MFISYFSDDYILTYRRVNKGTPLFSGHIFSDFSTLRHPANPFLDIHPPQNDICFREIITEHDDIYFLYLGPFLTL